jgi:23S rRNA (pseudouridine1915-N3)-methyltransferase
MRIKIIQIGKNKDTVISDMISEFVKRISPFASIEFSTLKEVVVSKSFPSEKCVEEEGNEVLKSINKEDFLIVLDERGKQFKSLEFAEILRSNKDIGRTVCFVIGGPWGISNKVTKMANLILSMSKMTFTHQMIRVFLLEQIYRGLSIIHGKGYHNE